MRKNDDEWLNRYNTYCEWVSTHKNFPLSYSKDSVEKSLASWMHNNKVKYKNGQLDEYRTNIIKQTFPGYLESAHLGADRDRILIKYLYCRLGIRSPIMKDLNTKTYSIILYYLKHGIYTFNDLWLEIKKLKSLNVPNKEIENKLLLDDKMYNYLLKTYFKHGLTIQDLDLYGEIFNKQRIDILITLNPANNYHDRLMYIISLLKDSYKIALILRRYGYRPRTYQEVADITHVSRARIGQIEAKLSEILSKPDYKSILRHGYYTTELEVKDEEAIHIDRNSELKYLKLNAREYNALHKLGIDNIGSLIEYVFEHDLYEIRGMGEGIVTDIITKIRDYLAYENNCSPDSIDISSLIKEHREKIKLNIDGNTDVASIGLGPRVSNALKRSNIMTVDELTSYIRVNGAESLYDIKGVGKKIAQEAIEKLKQLSDYSANMKIVKLESPEKTKSTEETDSTDKKEQDKPNNRVVKVFITRENFGDEILSTEKLISEHYYDGCKKIIKTNG